MQAMLADRARIEHLVQPTQLWRVIEVVETTGSTNADLSAKAHAGAEPGLVRIAMEQVGGRGRRTRVWASPKYASISLSVLIAPIPAVERWGWLSLLAGLALHDALSGLAPEADFELKWPNDVLLEGKKVCGILSEAAMTPTGPKAIIGIGINVSLTREQLPVPSATSLKLHGLCEDQSVICAAVLRSLEQRLTTWHETGDYRQAYRQRCASIGRELTISVEQSTPITGRGYGVDDDGSLQVSTAQGIKTFPVGDVVHASLS